jgi:hypothetical protein
MLPPHGPRPTAPPVLLPRTQPVRIVLWPITAILAFRAATSLDLCMGQPKLNFLNVGLGQVSYGRARINWYSVELVFQLSMFCIAARTLDCCHRSFSWPCDGVVEYY